MARTEYGLAGVGRGKEWFDSFLFSPSFFPPQFSFFLFFFYCVVSHEAGTEKIAFYFLGGFI